MARQSSNADKKLMGEGRKLLIKKGASSLSIRELTDRAGVNLGMFNYYFKTKENFVEKILDEIYSGFIFDLSHTENTQGIEKLRTQLLVTAKFVRDNRSLIVSLFNDVLSEEKVVQRFVRTKMRQHLIIVAKTVKQCQKDGLLIEAPLPLLMTQIVSGIGLTNLIPEFLKRLGVISAFNVPLGALAKQLTSDEALGQRVTITINGISTQLRGAK